MSAAGSTGTASKVGQRTPISSNTISYTMGEKGSHFKIVGSYRSALSRQVGEAVKIRRRGGEGSVLNSKGEFNRCKITRLTLGELPGRDGGEF